MVRKLDMSKPLKAKDVEYLRSRYPVSYVDHMIALAAGDSDLKADKAGGGADVSEDLIGDPEQGFDPKDHTEAEIKEHLAGADDAEKERVLGLEADGRGRKGILAL